MLLSNNNLKYFWHDDVEFVVVSFAFLFWWRFTYSSYLSQRIIYFSRSMDRLLWYKIILCRWENIHKSKNFFLVRPWKKAWLLKISSISCFSGDKTLFRHEGKKITVVMLFSYFSENVKYQSFYFWRICRETIL